MDAPIDLLRSALRRVGIPDSVRVVPEVPEIQAPREHWHRVVLEALRGAISACPRCPTLVQDRKRVVCGSGPPSAPLAFVGEAPGATEDERGVPFTGEAGRLLDQMLQLAKIPRQMCFFTNAIHCRPPGNRDPHAGEMEKCAPILWRELASVSPLVICTLGRFAAQAILGAKVAMKDIRGRVHILKNPSGFDILILPTVHPSACLHTRGSDKGSQAKGQIVHDLHKVRKLVVAQRERYQMYQATKTPK